MLQELERWVAALLFPGVPHSWLHASVLVWEGEMVALKCFWMAVLLQL